MEPMLDAAAQVALGFSCLQPLWLTKRLAKRLARARKPKLPLQRAVARRWIVVDPGLPPSEAVASRRKAGRPEGRAGTAQDLPDLARARVPDVDLVAVAASRGDEAPVGADRR